jgi:AraC family transcriptional activator of pobA
MTPANNNVLSLSSLESVNVTEESTTGTNIEVLCHCLQSIIAELHLRKPNRSALIHAHIRLLLIYLHRIDSPTTQTPMTTSSMTATASRSLALRFHQSVLCHISTAEINDEVKTVDFYARQLLVHPNHLSAVIKKCTGQSPRNFIHQQLLDKAKTLLTETAYSAKEIAYRLAFKDPAHFNSFFRKHTNQTPIHFRAHHANNRIPIS